MPNCVLCDSQNFDVMDGLYFCIQCGTQSQDVREEINEMFQQTDVSGRLAVGNKKDKKKKVYECGKPWFTLEGFQVVIKAQIEFLIKLGVDSTIKDVIGQMWFTFVEHTSNAFGTRAGKTNEKFTKTRDSIKDFIPTDSIHRKTPKLRYEKYDDDALELSSEIAREEFYEDDDPTRMLFDDLDEDGPGVDEESIGSIDQTKTKKFNKRKSYEDVQAMTLQHTLAFCFLGLLWLQEPICLSDLIRWALEGKLPYFNAASLFPRHMKLSQADITTFTRSRVPLKFNIKILARRLSKFITLPDIPEHQMNIYIARYSLDLKLPACIHRYVNSIVEMIDMDLQSFGAVICYDDLAMAYIIITLRLIYGLDDVTEHELSKLATDTEEDENLYFPVWNDLIESIHTSQSELLKYGIPWTKEDLRILKDCRSYSKFCHDHLFGSWKPEQTVHRYCRRFKGVKGLNAEKQEEYANMFSLLLNTEEKNQGGRESVTCFPFLSASKGEDIGNDSKSGNTKKTKGLPLNIISSYYERQTEENITPSNKTSNRLWKNRYSRYAFPVSGSNQLFDPKWWDEAPLAGSLRQLVEICSKLIHQQPAFLFQVVYNLENRLFNEENDD